MEWIHQVLRQELLKLKNSLGNRRSVPKLQRRFKSSCDRIQLGVQNARRNGTILCNATCLGFQCKFGSLISGERCSDKGANNQQDSKKTCFCQLALHERNPNENTLKPKTDHESSGRQQLRTPFNLSPCSERALCGNVYSVTVFKVVKIFWWFAWRRSVCGVLCLSARETDVGRGSLAADWCLWGARVSLLLTTD